MSDHATGEGVANATLETVELQIETILIGWGMSHERAVIATEAIVYADACGIDSHGISMLPLYEQMRARGTLDLEAVHTLVHDAGATVLIDGNAGLGHPIAVDAVDRVAAKAREFGVGVVSVFNSHHYGAAGYYVKQLADDGLIGLTVTTGRTPVVVPTHGSTPVLSTNPIAFGAPTDTQPTFLLDMATSTVAMNKIKVYSLNDKAMPPAWFVDGDGRPVIDPDVAMSAMLRVPPQGGITPLGGSDTPTGGHKGYGLSVMVELLSSALAGAGHAIYRADSAPDDIGHLFLAIDPLFVNPAGGFAARADTLIGTLRSVAPAGPEPVLIPGDPEELTRARRVADGIPLPAPLRRQIHDVCERAGVLYVLPAP